MTFMQDIVMHGGIVMHVVDKLSLKELRERLSSAPYGALRTRLQAVVLAKEGHTAPAIARNLGVSRRTVQDWVRWYNQEGVERLEGKVAPGTPPPLAPEALDQFLARIEAGPRPEDQVCALRGIEAQRILHQEFGVLRSLSTTLRILHQARFAKLLPRPQHPDADPAAQEAFKKKSCPPA
jgi:transposase